MSAKKGKRLGRFALWVFVIMVIAFSISGSIIAANHELIISKSGEFREGFIKESVDIDDDTLVSLDGIEKIYIDEVSSDINIIKADNIGMARIHYYGTVFRIGDRDLPKLDIKNDGNALVITVKREQNWFFNFSMLSEDTRIDIYIPEDYSGGLGVNTVSSEITASGLTLGVVKMETVSGAIKAEDINCADLDASSVSGKINISGGFGSSRFNTVSGEVEIAIDKLDGNMAIDTTSGQINVTLSEQTEGFGVYFSSVSGSFESGFEGLVINETGRNNFIGTYGNKIYEINAGSVSGSMRLN